MVKLIEALKALELPMNRKGAHGLNVSGCSEEAFRLLGIMEDDPWDALVIRLHAVKTALGGSSERQGPLKTMLQGFSKV